MTDLGREDESHEAMVNQRLDRTGLLVKLDKGFRPGDYCVFVEYDELAGRVGFTAARHLALDYCARLRRQLAGAAEYGLGQIEDSSRTGDPHRKRDLEMTFLSFDVTADDGRFQDAAIREQFRLALLRADQQWDQRQARAEEQRRDSRREHFRQRLDTLLAGENYRHVDGATRERLLTEVTALAFPPKGRER
jgi:hypothetical protein